MPATAAPRILVADDQADVITALRLVLRDAGFDCDTASSVHEIRHRLGTDRYDLVLMDLNYARDTTSGSEGLELLRELHAHDPLLPVVVMTGWGGVETAVEAMRGGARSFVQKPWNNDALAAAISREVRDGIAVREAHTLARRESEAARTSQRALLPTALPAPEGCTLAARSRPASELGGDCYDAVPLTENITALSIADVCGKGLPAALVMSHVQGTSRALAHGTPAAIAAGVNQVLCRSAGLAHFVTCFFAAYDAAARTLTYTNAGHNPPMLVRAGGTIERLTEGGTVLGAFEHATFVQGDVTLHPGDRVVFFTDGITEALAADELFGDERLAATVHQYREAGAAPMVAAVFDAVESFAGGRLHDDATVMVLAIDDRAADAASAEAAHTAR